MAKEGSVAPKERINVTFKPATGGAQEELELPLKLMVLGDFTQRADDRKIEDRKPISIDKNSFDEVLAKQELNLTFSVPNRLQDVDHKNQKPCSQHESADRRQLVPSIQSEFDRISEHPPRHAKQSQDVHRKE